MKKNHNSPPDDLERFFKDQLGDGSMEPSPGLWDKIESELDEKKKPALLFPGLGLLLLVAVGISLGVYFYGSKPKDAKKDAILAKQETAKQTDAQQLAMNPAAENNSQQSEPSGEQNTARAENGANSTSAPADLNQQRTGKEIKNTVNANEQKLPSNVNTSSDNKAAEDKAVQSQGSVIAINNTNASVSSANSGELSPTESSHMQVKSETASGNSDKEKSNTFGKTRPVLGSNLNKTKAESATALPANTNDKEIAAGDSPGNPAVVSASVNSTEQLATDTKNNSVTESEAAKNDAVTTATTNQNAEAKAPASAVKPDSLPAEEPYGKLALSVGIGLSQVMNSNLPQGEHWLSSFGDECKLQFRPVKYLSVNVGVGYSFYKTSRDATDFVFDKQGTGDYIFQTTVGNIAMDYANLKQGSENTPAAVTKLRAKYAYDSQIDFVNLPVEVQAHFVNRKKFRMWSGLGVNTSYVLSQNTRFSVIKDKETEDYTYSDVLIQRMNSYLTVSLGCDIKFRDKMYVYISPSYRYGFTNMSRGTGITFRPQAFMAVAGIKFILK